MPGQHETIRIDGPAYLTTDEDVLARFTEEVRRPPLAVVVEVAAVFTHCAKAFRRGRLWQPASWVDGRSLALAARYAQLALDESYDEYAAANDVKIDEGLAADQPASP